MTTRPANVVPLLANGIPSTSATPWLSVLLAVGAGMLAAFQVGKVHIALPSIPASFSLSSSIHRGYCPRLALLVYFSPR